MTPQEVEPYLQSQLEQWGFSHFGVARIERPLTMDFYVEWINSGMHGEMSYLKEHLPIKENPQSKWPRIRTAFVFAIPYFPHPASNTSLPLKKARISLYAQGMDYHHWFKEKLQGVCQMLQGHFPDEEFLSFTDSSPILERDLARKVGLGWQGKNTCIIHPKKGSLFFIGEVFSSLDLEPVVSSNLLPDFCGSCTRCIDICPTQALVAPQMMDARKCISYLTIESKSNPPEELREKIGDWFFGCDLCQTICPWNQKQFKNILQTDLKLNYSEAETLELEAELKLILESSGKKIAKLFAGTPLARAGAFGLKRNAIIVATNRQLRNLRPQIASLHEHPKLSELVQWSLEKLKN